MNSGCSLNYRCHKLMVLQKMVVFLQRSMCLQKTLLRTCEDLSFANLYLAGPQAEEPPEEEEQPEIEGKIFVSKNKLTRRIGFPCEKKIWK